MGGIDFKEIGLAAKDIVFGIGSAAAGASGGPAAAEGVSKAGSGLDRILGMAGVMETRADKFDRADFAARPQQAAAPAQPVSTPVQPAASPAPAVTVPREAGPIGDEQIAADHLRGRGWSRAKLTEILRGPEHTSLAALFGKDTKGFRARGAEGTRIAQVDGAAVPTHPARVVPSAEGQVVRTVHGTRVRDDPGTGRT